MAGSSAGIRSLVGVPLPPVGIFCLLGPEGPGAVASATDGSAFGLLVLEGFRGLSSSSFKDGRRFWLTARRSLFAAGA